MISIPSVKFCGEDMSRWQERYKALRDRWRELEVQIKIEADPKRKERLSERQRDIGADRNKAMGKIAQLVNRLNEGEEL